MKRNDNIISLLNELKIIDKNDITYSGIEILEIKSHWKNGNALKHHNGDNYKIVYFKAITKSSKFKIIKIIENSHNVPEEQLKLEILDLLIKKYINGNTEKYNTWKVGDIGQLYIDSSLRNNNAIFSNTNSN